MLESLLLIILLTTATQLESNLKESILNQASELLGCKSIRYIYESPELGQSPTEGFDCSGFVSFVLRQSGISIPEYIGKDGIKRRVRHANEFWDNYGVIVHEDLVEPGDLIFFTRRAAQGYFPNHIGIVKDPESYIHAPGINGTKVAVAAIREQRVKPVKDLGRVIYSHNPIGYKASTLPVPEPTYRLHQYVI